MDKLRDIHLPAEVSWWPLALGWWLVLALLLLGVVLAVAWRRGWMPGRGYRHRRALQRNIVQACDAIAHRFDADHDAAAACSALSDLMRRVALHCFPAQQVAGLQGQAWLAFLDCQGVVGAKFANSAVGDLLVQGAYQPQVEGDVAQLIAQCRAWMDAVATGKRVSLCSSGQGAE